MDHPSEALKARYSFTSKDIRQFGFQFIALQAAIQNYARRIRKDKRGNVPLVEELLKQATAARGKSR
jgi:hypothetical protein